MFWDRSHHSSDIEDRRGHGPTRMGGFGGGGFPIGLLAMAGRFGWKGILVALLLLGFMGYGGMCGGMSTCNGLTGDVGGERPAVNERGPRTSTSPQEDELARFVGFVLDDVQNTWVETLPGYRRTKLVLFRDAVASACGTASSAVGPFYCPLDRKVYIDLSFYEELQRKFGAPGDFAQAYVIAHEVGHHIQNLRGLLGRGEVHAIETELQADCLAGAWARSAQSRGLLEVGDLDEALNAARQIGDDTIQKRTRGRVQPETWTHGSAAQRKAAVEKGLAGGVAACGLR